jgi:nucleotide-binding universal stress UspA family protein
MTTIVAGLDESAHARDALAFARDLSAATGARLVLATAYPYEPHPSRLANPDYEGALRSDAHSLLERLAADVGGNGVGVVEKRAIAGTRPAKALHELAVHEGASLIVVGSSEHGRRGRVVPGSTAERLLHGSPCSVAVVPQGYHERADRALRAITVAFDESDEASAALKGATALARAFGATVHVTHVFAPVEEMPAVRGGAGYQALADELEHAARTTLDTATAALPADVQHDAVWRTGDPVHELAEASAQSDLVVCGSRGYGPLRAVMVGGFTGPFLREAACPVIVVPRGVEYPLGDLVGDEAVSA